MLHRINWALVFALALSFAFSLLPHLLDIRQFFKHQETFFLDGKPFIQNPDGYFFGRLAKAFAEGVPIEEDPLRNFPEDGIKYRYTPLISVIYGFLMKMTGLPLEWVGFWFSPILGSLFVVPLVLLWHKVGNLWIGFAGAVITALSSAYLMRVFVLDIDTDSLNLFFIFSVALFLWLAYQNKNHWKGYAYYSLALLFSFLFYWWYAHPEFFVLSFLGFWLLTFKSSRFFLFSLFGFLVLWVGISFMAGYPVGFDILQRVFIYFGFKFPVIESQSIPEVMKTIGEQGKVSFLKTSGFYFSSEIPFYIALVFLPVFFIRYIKVNLLLLPLWVLLLFAFLKGNNRLYMYVSPLLSMSFAYAVFFISQLKNYVEKPYLKAFVGYAFPALMLLIGINWLSVLSRFPSLFIQKEVVQSMIELKKFTPQDAKILTWWDYGYPIVYYSQRTVFHDGGSQFSVKTPLIAYALMSEEEKANRLFACVSNPAFNLKTFQQVRELGLYTALKEASKSCNPPRVYKTYLLITEDMLDKIGAISYLAFGKSQSILRLPKCEPPYCEDWINQSFGLYVQKFNQSTTEYEFKKLVEVREQELKEYAYNRQKGFVIYRVIKDEGVYAFAVPENLEKSALITLYTIRKNREGFRLVYDNFPYAVVYEITSYKPPLSLP